MAAIFPSRMPTSPEYQGEPVPSTMCPLRMTMSNAASGIAAVVKLIAQVIAAMTSMGAAFRMFGLSVNSAPRFKLRVSKPKMLLC
jgi:hypothetical protein